MTTPLASKGRNEEVSRLLESAEQSAAAGEMDRDLFQRTLRRVAEAGGNAGDLWWLAQIAEKARVIDSAEDIIANKQRPRRVWVWNENGELVPAEPVDKH